MLEYIEQYVRIIGVITWTSLGLSCAEAGAADFVLHVIEPVEGYDSLFVHDLGPDGEVLGVAYNYDGGNAIWMGPKDARKVFTQPNWIQLTVIRMNDAGMVLGAGGAGSDDFPTLNAYVWNPLTESTWTLSSNKKSFQPFDMNKIGEVSGTASWYVLGKKPQPGAGEGGEKPEEEVFYVDQRQAFVAGPSGIKFHGITETYEWEGGGGTNTGSFGAWGLGLNSFGIVLGRQNSRLESDIGVSWPGGERLGPNNRDRYYADQINDLNEAAGFYQEYDEELERYVSLIPVLYKIGQYSSVSLPVLSGTTGGYAAVLNDKGVVAGFCYSLGEAFPVMWTRIGLDWKVESLAPYLAGWSDIYLSRVGTEGSIIGAGTFEGEWRWFVLAPPGLQIAVDANRDGTTRFAGDPEVEDNPALSDETSPEKPFRFWINDDQDKWGDLGESENASRKNPNSQDRKINGPRDLEDFARLTIKLRSDWSQKFKSGSRLVLETTGGINIRCFRAPDGMTEETTYLKDKNLAESYLGNDFMFNKQPRAANLERLHQVLTPSDYEEGRLLLLWEGVNAGTGTIIVRLVGKDGKEVDRDEVDVELRPAWEMIQKGEAELPAPYIFPYRNGGLFQTPAYRTVGQFAPAQDEENRVICYVHGINMSDWDWRMFSETMYKRLWHAGYKGRFASFRWPSNLTNIQGDTNKRDALNMFRYNEMEYLAFKSAPALRQFRESFPSGYSVNMVGHSQGNVVVSEALKQGMSAESYAAMQAAFPAIAYDDNNLLAEARLVQAEAARPTPQTQTQMGYRGYCLNLNTRLISFFNRDDFALRSGTLVFGRIFANWEANQIQNKPDSLENNIITPIGIIPAPYAPLTDSWNHFYDYTGNTSGLYRRTYPNNNVFEVDILVRHVTMPSESLAMVARSVSSALGAVAPGVLPNGGGSVKGRVDLAEFGLGRERSDHSGQFNRVIQENMVPLYETLLDRFKP